ncbi:uncharacterized protein LOC134831294 [Culicoides brevitarsis]|uniref:uncharacterized protein LOC134831294 n=1 Tax=Culicoides brevitarsis TaxID=469753 RepID=UPI00307CA33D
MASFENMLKSEKSSLKMVQGVDLVLIDVAFLTYNAKRDLHNPLVKLDSTCVAGAYELKKHKEMKRKQKYEMGLDAYKHYKWYNSCLKLECLKSDQGPASANSKLKILHWHIESGNIEAFRMQGVTYKAVSIIISPNVEYWYCANQGPNGLSTFGSRARGTSFTEMTLNSKKNANSAEIWFEPLISETCCNENCKKNNCQCKKETIPLPAIKSKTTYIKNKLEKENQVSSEEASSVMKAIELLNQKKNILRKGVNGIPKVQNSRRDVLKPICEDRNS